MGFSMSIFSHASSHANSQATRTPRKKRAVRVKRKPIKIARRKAIPVRIRECVWRDNNGDGLDGRCFCCDKPISFVEFECGHVVSVADGGSDDAGNLRPVCTVCNRSMGTQNLDAYKKIVRASLHPQ